MYACLYRPPERERGDEVSPAASADLVAIAQEFSPRYESLRGGVAAVMIDVRGLERLLGDARAIGEELRREAARRAVRVHVAVAPTRTAAVILAIANPGLTVVAGDDVRSVLAPLALGILEKIAGDHDDVSRRALSGPPAGGEPKRPALQDAVSASIATFQRWGLKTLGEVAALPPADLSSRLGRLGLRWQALARGDDIRPLVPDAAEERFESFMDLEWPIEGLEPMSFVLTRLLEPLSIRLERRDRGVAVLHVQLRLVGGDAHECRLELPSPMRDVRTLRTLALLDLESHPPPAAIEQVAILIEPTPGRVVQHTLFARPQLTPEQLSTLLARLGAVMGQDRIGSPATVDSYRPGVFAMRSFAPAPEPRVSSPEPRATSHESQPPTSNLQPLTSGLQPPTSVLRRCRQPVPGRVAADASGRPVRVTTDRRGFAGGTVVHASGPWRTSGEWWNLGAGGAGTAGKTGGENGASHEARSVPPIQPVPPSSSQPGWDRDEWDVSLSDGGSYRVFMDRVTGGWFIDAIYD